MALGERILDKVLGRSYAPLKVWGFRQECRDCTKRERYCTEGNLFTRPVFPEEKEGGCIYFNVKPPSRVFAITAIMRVYENLPIRSNRRGKERVLFPEPF